MLLLRESMSFCRRSINSAAYPVLALDSHRNVLKDELLEGDEFLEVGGVHLWLGVKSIDSDPGVL